MTLSPADLGDAQSHGQLGMHRSLDPDLGSFPKRFVEKTSGLAEASEPRVVRLESGTPRPLKRGTLPLGVRRDGAGWHPERKARVLRVVH